LTVDRSTTKQNGHDGTVKPAGEDFQVEPELTTRTYVLMPWNKRGKKGASDHRRTPEARLEEAIGLAAAIHLDIVTAEIVPLHTPRPATLFGSGKVEEFADRLKHDEIELVIVDGQLTPGQQRNLERAWKTKVLDRTGLILEIFGERARTREGRLQVELAHLSYQKSRLVRSWTHLERQRGGVGFLGGPGETQIEADRRALQEKINRLEKDIAKVKRTRELHRKTRRATPYPVVALVGYTNAGKSTLFNRITKADVFAENLLFATLDPTMRAVTLPSGRKIILSDTVGFISDLPTHLVASFRATLEEVLEAEIVLHVRDAAHDETEAQKLDVIDVLKTLGLDVESEKDTQFIEVLNKVDLLDAEVAEALVEQVILKETGRVISALTGKGVESLLSHLDELLSANSRTFNLTLEPRHSQARAWLHSHGDVNSDIVDEEGRMQLQVSMTSPDAGRFEKLYPEIFQTALADFVEDHGDD